jgi:hypothetical protein
VPIYSPHRFKLTQVRLGQLYPMGLGYIHRWRGAMLLEPDETRTYLAGRIYPMGCRICLTRPPYHGSGTRRGDRTCPAGQVYTT